VFTEADQELAVFRELVAIRGVDGFILSGAGVREPRAGYLHQAGVPFAVFGGTAAGLPQSWVDIDSRAAVAAVVDYLVARGHGSFAYLGYDTGQAWDRERLAGFRTGLAAHGLGVAEGDVILGWGLEGLKARVRGLLAGRGRPTAIVSGSDVLAAVAVNAARALGLGVGRDLA
jgi:DNA-binding LacI/PurR family transcriptional regulator